MIEEHTSEEDRNLSLQLENIISQAVSTKMLMSTVDRMTWPGKKTSLQVALCPC